MTDYVDMLVNGDHVLPVLLHDLESAERAIDLSMFLFFRDPIGEEIAALLAKKARAGVAVRVLINIEKTEMGDPFSTGEKEMMKHDPHVEYDPMDVTPLCDMMRQAGVEVLDTNIDYGKEAPHADGRLRSVGAQIRDTIAIDDLHIDHRKVVVIDGRIAYCGGANVGAQYLFHHPFDPHKHARKEGDELKAQNHPEPWWKWHDSLTRFEGEVVRALDAHFHDRWVLDGGQEFQPIVDSAFPSPPRGHGAASTQVLVNEPNDQPNQVRELYVRMIQQAQRSIFIENPYLYHPAIVDALLASKRARPDLRVDLIVPALEWNDNELAQDAQQYHYAKYLEVGIGVHEYQCHFNHLKTAVFDERWSIHGSTNLNFRSLEDDKDFEMVVLVDCPSLAREMLERVRDVDLGHAKRFEKDDVEGSLWKRLHIKTRDPRTLLLLSRRVL